MTTLFFLTVTEKQREEYRRAEKTKNLLSSFIVVLTESDNWNYTTFLFNAFGGSSKFIRSIRKTNEVTNS